MAQATRVLHSVVLFLDDFCLAFLFLLVLGKSESISGQWLQFCSCVVLSLR